MNGPPAQSPDGPRRLRRRHLWNALLAIGVAIAVIWVARSVLKEHEASSSKAAPPPGVPITTVTARTGDIGVYLNALGTVTPVATVSVVSRVQGEIVTVAYKEGQMVRKGALLLEIDERPYQVQLAQAEAQYQHDEAVLNEARIDLDRYAAAYGRNAIAKQQLDDQEQTVRQDEGTLKSDQAQIDNAKLQLVYCRLTSPIDGRLGLRLVDPGNMVQANGATPLVVVTQLQPITVIFSIAEDSLPQIQQQLRQGHRLSVDAFDRLRQKKIASGSLLTLDNTIDPTTGTVKLKASFPNTDNALFPNQFVNARLLVDTEHGVTLVPTAAVQRSADGAFVYVIQANQTAAMRTISVGTTDGTTAAIQNVKAGEVLASNGFDKLQDGVKVAIGNDADSRAGDATP